MRLVAELDCRRPISRAAPDTDLLVDLDIGVSLVLCTPLHVSIGGRNRLQWSTCYVLASATIEEEQAVKAYLAH